jgi:CHAT domain-containing protein
MADDGKLERHCARIEKAFGRPPALLLAEEEDNLIAFALHGGPRRLPWAQLKARAREAHARFGLRLEECLASLKERNSGNDRYLEL